MTNAIIVAIITALALALLWYRGMYRIRGEQLETLTASTAKAVQTVGLLTDELSALRSTSRGEYVDRPGLTKAPDTRRTVHILITDRALYADPEIQSEVTKGNAFVWLRPGKQEAYVMCQHGQEEKMLVTACPPDTVAMLANGPYMPVYIEDGVTYTLPQFDDYMRSREAVPNSVNLGAAKGRRALDV